MRLWPGLKRITNDLDFAADYAPLIPRALQCDEDLTRLALELKTFLILRYGPTRTTVASMEG